MDRQELPSTSELGELQLQLRSDLEFVMREYGGEKHYVVEDRGRANFYQVGIAEYTFISLFDGKTSLNEAIRLTATRLGADAFTERHAISVVKWLVDCQLVFTDDSTQTERLLETAASNQQRKRATRLNPILLKLPLFNPERLLNALTPWFGWMTSQAAVVGWLMLCGLAVWQLLGSGDELFAAANHVVDRDNWLWLAVTWLGLRFFHEMGHAMTCRQLGGHVRDCGVMLILLVPIPYVDVTSSWRFASKWQRIATSAAGMYVELGLAAIATLVWINSDNPLIQHHAYNIMLLGSVTTLLFNANFLMRFDGYYMLADWLEIPNLYSLGQQYVQNLGRRWVLGVKVDAPRWRRGAVIRLYGLASLIWRVFVCACLVISAQALLFGFGLILSLVGVLMWVGAPVFRFFAYLLNRERTETVSYRRLLIVTGSAAAVLIAAFTVIPWPLRIAAPAIVQYSGASRIYTETSGIVTAVHVQPGQKVKLGQLLFQLSNRELQAGLRELKLSIEQTRIRARQYQLQERLGAYQAELSSLENLQRKLAETQAQVDALQVLAPNPGTIVARELDALVDQFLRSGTEVLMIADEAEKKLTLSIHQDDIAHFRAQLGQDISVSLLPPLATDCRLDAIVPRASDEVSHDALIAPSSGPIAVRPNESPGAQRSQWRYLSPRFQGTVHLSAAEAQQTRVGQTAQVKLSAHDGTLGGHLYKIVRNWFRQQLTRPTKATA